MIREKLEIIEGIGSIKVTLVEMTGSKVTELLQKSNAWSNQDYSRMTV